MCGIFGFTSITLLSVDVLYQGLRRLQHRGQDGYGIATDHSMYHALGMVPETCPEETTYNGIGHVRYSTSSQHDNAKFLHPLHRDGVYLAHNGHIIDAPEHDSAYLLSLLDPDKIEDSLINIMNYVKASYSLLVFHKDTMYVLRDRYGIRPLFIQQTKNSIYVASETCAFTDQNNHNNILEVSPGSIIKCQGNEKKLLYQYPQTKDCLDAFELLYFMNNSSIINQQRLKDIRHNLGCILAQHDVNKFSADYVVVGVPNSGISAAKGYAQTLNLSYEQLITLTKSNKKRTFITSSENRKQVCHKKFLIDNVKDKKLIIIDDTIVRGTVMKSIVDSLRQLGAKEIHVRIPAPPVIDVHRMGVAIHSKKELLMQKYTIKQVEQLYNIDSLFYLSIYELRQIKIFPDNSYMEFFGVPFNLD